MNREELVDERGDLLVRQVLVDDGVVGGVDRVQLRPVNLAVVGEALQTSGDAPGDVVGGVYDLLLAV